MTVNTSTAQMLLPTAPVVIVAAGRRRAEAPLWTVHFVFAYLVFLVQLAVWFVKSFRMEVAGPHLITFAAAFVLLFAALFALAVVGK